MAYVRRSGTEQRAELRRREVNLCDHPPTGYGVILHERRFVGDWEIVVRKQLVRHAPRQFKRAA